MTNNDFKFAGLYRTQSHRTQKPSTLIGRWDDKRANVLDAPMINAALAMNPLFRGHYEVNLWPAVVAVRTGAFDADDALYYRRQFTPDRGTEQMLTDVLDISKLKELWVRRYRLLASLFCECDFSELLRLLGDHTSAAINEYLCHEAGHALGWNVDAKYSSGYFRLNGKPAWPLIFVEEFRADMAGLSIACELLSAADAASLFIFHMFHRFGLAGAASEMGSVSAGMVPLFLFSLLRNAGLIHVVRRSHCSIRLSLDSLVPAFFVERLATAAREMTRELTGREMDARSLMDIALNAASFYRSCLSSECNVREYRELFRVRGISNT